MPAAGTSDLARAPVDPWAYLTSSSAAYWRRRAAAAATAVAEASSSSVPSDTPGAPPAPAAHARDCVAARQLYTAKLQSLVQFHHFARAGGTCRHDPDFGICHCGDVDGECASAQRPRDAAACCVGMRDFTEILENRVSKRAACALFSGHYMPLERHTVVLAPAGWGKAHCTRVFCERHRVNLLEVGPYLHQARLITDTVAFARALGTPTVIFFKDAHKWLHPPAGAAAAAPASPLLGDYLHACDTLERCSDPVWMVYGSEFAPAYFYADFRALPHVAAVECNAPLCDAEIARLVRHTLGARLRALGFEALSDTVAASNAVLVRWARAQIEHTLGDGSGAATFGAFSPRAIVRVCHHLLASKLQATSARKLARMVHLHRAAAAGIGNDTVGGGGSEEYTRLVATSFVLTDADFLPSTDLLSRMQNTGEFGSASTVFAVDVGDSERPGNASDGAPAPPRAEEHSLDEHAFNEHSTFAAGPHDYNYNAYGGDEADGGGEDDDEGDDEDTMYAMPADVRAGLRQDSSECT